MTDKKPDTPDDADADDSPAPEDTTDASPRVDPSAGTSGRTPSSVSRLTVALVVAVVVLAALSVMLFLDRGRMQDDLDRTDDIAAVASEFGRALYSYDYRDIEGQLGRVEALTTPDYAEQYRQDFEANLKAQIVEREVVSTGEVHQVLVNQSDGDQAQAIVITTTTVEGPDDTSGSISTLVQLSMVRLDGEWLVDKVLTIANQGTVTDAEGQPVVTTTTPEGGSGESTSSVPSVPDQTEQEPAEDGE